jgi:hypothetical protein
MLLACPGCGILECLGPLAYTETEEMIDMAPNVELMNELTDAAATANAPIRIEGTSFLQMVEVLGKIVKASVKEAIQPKGRQGVVSK